MHVLSQLNSLLWSLHTERGAVVFQVGLWRVGQLALREEQPRACQNMRGEEMRRIDPPRGTAGFR